MQHERGVLRLTGVTGMENRKFCQKFFIHQEIPSNRNIFLYSHVVLLIVHSWPIQCIKCCTSDQNWRKNTFSASSEIGSWPTGSCSLFCFFCFCADWWMASQQEQKLNLKSAQSYTHQAKTKKSPAVDCNRITILLICIPGHSLWLPNQIQHLFHYIISYTQTWS